MDACHLGKYILANNRFIGGNDDARVGLHHTAYVVQAAFVNVGNGIEVVFQDSLHTGKRSIAGAFAQAVNGSMQSLATAKYGGKHIAHGKVIVIVGMEVKMGMRIAFHHLAHKLNDLQRVQYAQRVRQHIAADIGLLQGVHQTEHIFRRIFHAVAPVFQIDIHYHILLVGVIHYGQNILDMLFGSLLQLVGAMLQRAFAQQIDDTATGRMYPVHRRVAIYKAKHFYSWQQITACRPVTNHFYGIKLSFGYPRRSHLHPVYLQFLQ